MMRLGFDSAMIAFRYWTPVVTRVSEKLRGASERREVLKMSRTNIYFVAT